MSHGIAFVTAAQSLPDDLQRLDDGDEFTVTVIQGIKRGPSRPLPEDTACIVVGHDPPEIDGLATIDWLRDRYASLPIVLFPSQRSEALAAAAVNVSIDAYVPQSDGGSTDRLRSHLRRLAARSVPAGKTDGTRSDRAPTPSAELSEAMPMFEALLTSLPRWVSIYVKDRLGRHVAISGSDVAFQDGTMITTPDGKELHSREDLLGKTDFDIYSAGLATQTRPQEQEIMRTEEPIVNYIETVENPLGETVHNSTTKAPWYDERGEVAGIVGITVDITDRIERRQALERQNDRLDRFAGVLSHDLRNPLTVASGQVELLDELDLPEEATGPIDDLDWSLERIEALVENTLTLAREGSTVTNPEPVDLERRAREAWRAAGDDRGELVLDEELPSVAGDPDRVQRLLENLFRNALEHGCDGSGLSVAVGPLEQGFYVADDGCGIPADRREAVFEHGYSTQDGGTGFGLAIVEEIAAAHDWKPSVTESGGGGVRVEFRDVTSISDGDA